MVGGDVGEDVGKVTFPRVLGTQVHSSELCTPCNTRWWVGTWVGTWGAFVRLFVLVGRIKKGSFLWLFGSLDRALALSYRPLVTC